MAVTRATIASVALLAVLGALACTAFQAHQTTRPPNMAKTAIEGTAPGNSPVKIVGGSMTLRSIVGWTNSSGQLWNTTSQINASPITLERVVLAGTNGPTNSITLNLTVPWQIELDARQNDGKAANPTKAGVYVCTQGAPSASTGCPMTGALASPTNIFIGPKDPSSVGVGFNPNDAPQGPFDSQDQGKRYMDQSGTCKWGGFCEHIWQVIITFGSSSYTFFCPDGQCRIYVGS